VFELSKQIKGCEEKSCKSCTEGTSCPAPIPEVDKIPEDLARKAEQFGINPYDLKRSGSFVLMDHKNNLLDIHPEYTDKFEMLDIREAMLKYEWVLDYMWNLISPEKDEFTKAVQENSLGGYFIWVKKDQKIDLPVQSCMMIKDGNKEQRVHNIIVIEEGAEVNVLTACLTRENNELSRHLGISEMYIKKGGKLNFTMIHDWNRNAFIRPRTAVHVEERGEYISNYILLSEVEDLQTNPYVTLEEGASTAMNSLVYGKGQSKIDIGSQVILKGKNSKTQQISRVICDDESFIVSRGLINGQEISKGHLECVGLMLSKNAKMHAVPELLSESTDAELSHEAAVGKIAQEEIIYLMSRGLSEDDATSVIVRGFLDINILGLPDEFKKQVKDIIDKVGEEGY
jgi:uncharacterized protein